MQKMIEILCTRPLDATLIDEAKQAGIDIDELSFIKTEPIQSLAIRQEIEQALLLTAVVVFTSMNAVEAVAYYKEDNEPAWEIYCMGNTTMRLVSKYFGEEKIAGIANDATELAQRIAKKNSTEEVIFFCGDQRRDELPAILRSNGVYVNEIIVYQTVPIPHKISKAYHGMLFFSPSAVVSFFTHNNLPAATIIFAIGNTTANEIKKYSKNKIIISNEPGKEHLVREMMAYYN